MKTTPIIPTRGIHLDLKGLPPTPARLLTLVDLFAAAKINCVLVEWEDAFPWTVDQRFRSETAYTLAQVEEFHARCEALGIEVIPLVQSLGHMETPLQPNDYAHLREVPNRCDVLNPLAPGARGLVERMIDDVLSRTPTIKHFHLGGDEAWTFGTHPDTKAFIAQYETPAHGKAALYLHHIEPLLDKLNAKNIRPILWHDMMHDWDAAALNQLAKKADLMFWSYRGHPDTAREGFNTKTLEHFNASNVPLWGACAYKGADGPDADLPDIQARIANACAFAEVAPKQKMKGVIATAWSRYATHRVQNEPIDGALDALIKVTTTLHDGQPATDKEVEDFLNKNGELQRFTACKAALGKLSQSRKESWQYELNARQQIATEQQDQRRQGSGMLDTLRKIQSDHTAAAQAAAEEVRKAFVDLIDPIWIDRYINERLMPLQPDKS